MITFLHNLKNFCTSTVAKKAKQKTLAAIIMFELSYFKIVICKLPCVIKEAGNDIDPFPPPPHSISQAVNSNLYKPVKYHFQERRFVRLEL